MRKISLLGSTGSIGTTTLQIVREYRDQFSVVGLAAGRNLDLLKAQIREFQPKLVSVADEAQIPVLRSEFPLVDFVTGARGLTAVATLSEADVVVAAIVGFAGMESTLAAVQAHKTVGLANKEAMITAGPLMVRALKESRSVLLPIDSEHNALFQCLEGGNAKDLKRILLTCSGGPFRRATKEDLKSVTVDQALKHPKWVMGRKITIDSATLMNKGLEMIEAKFLFGLSHEQVSVVIHPESVIHSMVEWIDGAVTASLGETTMRGPIAHVLHYPRRLPGVLKPIEWGKLGQLTFEEPDAERFPSLRLAADCLRRGGNAPVVLNAANEIAVEAFLNRELSFLQIYETIEESLQRVEWRDLTAVADVIDADRQAREVATSFVRRRKHL